MRDGSEYSENWYELTRKGHVWDIPFIIIGPLMFASLMIALSLRQEIHELVVGALLVMPRAAEEGVPLAGDRGRTAKALSRRGRAAPGAVSGARRRAGAGAPSALDSTQHP